MQFVPRETGSASDLWVHLGTIVLGETFRIMSRTRAPPTRAALRQLPKTKRASRWIVGGRLRCASSIANVSAIEPIVELLSKLDL